MSEPELLINKLFIDNRVDSDRPSLTHNLTPSVSVSTYDQIYAVVRQIPRGQVATYGQVAELASLYGQARLVGYALYRVDKMSDIPWHRVINAKGEISESSLRLGSDYLQRSLLEQEGIQFNQAGKINLRDYLWQPASPLLDLEVSAQGED